MKNLKIISDSDLLTEIRSLCSDERRMGIDILYRFREIEFRQLHVREGYESLHEFAVKELRYSDGAAHRRIQAMRLLKDLPEAEQGLKTGELTLSHASQLQDFFRAEKKLGNAYAPSEKLELLKEMNGKSTRQAQALLMERSPEAMPRESLKPLGLENSKLTVILSRELQEKLQKLKSLLAHSVPAATYAELLDKIADIALKAIDPEQKKSRQVKAKSPAAEVAPAQKLELKPETSGRTARAQDRRLVWKRAGNRCEHTVNGRRCTSTYALQIDHIHPHGKGGSNHLDNLQLLCRAHNAHKNLGDYGFLYRAAGQEGSS